MEIQFSSTDAPTHILILYISRHFKYKRTLILLLLNDDAMTGIWLGLKNVMIITQFYLTDVQTVKKIKDTQVVVREIQLILQNQYVVSLPHVGIKSLQKTLKIVTMEML